MIHHFEIEDAEKYGIEAAIILSNIKYWIAKNKANDKYFKNGKYWTYNSYTAFSKLFPYMSEGVIKRAIQKLEQQNVIESAILNTNGYDRTKWYSLVEYSSAKTSTIHEPKIADGSDTFSRPIPDVNTNTNTNVVAPPPASNEIPYTYEEYKKENDNKSLQECAHEYFYTTRWRQAINLLCHNLNVTEIGLKYLALEFNKHRALQGKIEQNITEWGRHFGNWAKNGKRIAAAQEKQGNGLTAEQNREIFGRP